MTLDDPKIREALDEPELPRMSFGDHLDELRSRLIKSLLAVVVAILAVMPFKGPVQGLIIEPYRIAWRHGFEKHVAMLEQMVAAAKDHPEQLDPETAKYLTFCRDNYAAIIAGTKGWKINLQHNTGYALPYSLYATGGLEDMFSFLWASIVFALVLASPVVIWQAWAFIAAGLYPKERSIFYRYFPFMMGLLAGGVLFGYFVVLPTSLGFLVSWMDPDQVNAIFSIGQFLTLEFALTGAMGLVFQLPLVMLALQKIGLVSHRAFRQNWRMTVLIIFIVAAILTPPEPVSMLMMAVPMLLLYVLGLALTWLGSGRDAKVVVAS